MATRKKTATFRFYGDLNDFLPARQHGSSFPYRFNGHPAVKDAIEAVGVPHPEVNAIRDDERLVGFGYALSGGAEIHVYPHARHHNGATGDWPDGSLQPPLPEPLRFVLDVHLGQLARNLRMLGFDTRYANDLDDPALARIAADEARILLTRDVGLLKRSMVVHGAFVRATDPDEQVTEVLNRYAARDAIDPLSRCIRCNTPLESVPKPTVAADLPPKVRTHYDVFYQCPACEQVYWNGSHVERMQNRIDTWSSRP